VPGLWRVIPAERKTRFSRRPVDALLRADGAGRPAAKDEREGAVRLENKVAIVTGGASGIGRATVEAFVREGAIVTIADKNGAAARALAQAMGNRTRAFEVDVARSAEVKAMIDDTVAARGRLDILFNNAGYGITGSVTEVSEDDWDALLAVNVNGVFHGCRHAIPVMAAGGGGAIVNTASVVADRGIKDRAAYVTSKGAVAAMTRAMALDHVHQNIRVNAVAPGTIESPYFQRLFAEHPDAPAMKRALEARQPMDRLGQPLEIANAVVFLASAEASFCTGMTMYVDGGWTAR
jgi:NAD(P)-dependent dehydrogenase (short-subunit alcohol dehydrogenase family)